MNDCHLTIILIWSIVGFVSSAPRRTKSETIKKYTQKKGEAIAVDRLIRKYELEHQRFYKEEIGEGTYLEWLELDKRDLSEFCRKYLQHAVPGRTTNNASGTKINKILSYEKENKSFTSNVVLVQCKVRYKSDQLVYYMTRAPEPKCVYALNSAGYRRKIIFNIVQKYCDFEVKPVKESIKWKQVEFIHTIHTRTGQPIAKDEYLLKYELDHQALLDREGIKGKQLEWPRALSYYNLDSYCYQYVKKCFPGRCKEFMKGSWKTETIRYQKLKTHKDIFVTVVQCVQGRQHKVTYYITRATETNCVYALLRMNGRGTDPLMIIFKHCDFEFPNNQSTIPQVYYNLDNTLIPKTEVKEEVFDTLEMLQLFPHD